MFKRSIFVFSVLFVFCVFHPVQAWDRRAYANRHSQCYGGSLSIRQLLALPDEEIDLATVLLEISAFMQRASGSKRVDVAGMRARIDGMADQISSRIKDERLPVRIVEIMNKYIYGELGYKYDHAFGPASLYLDETLQNNKGVCLTFSLLYLCLAERLNLPFYGVIVPGHMFVRFDDGQTRFNIDQGGFNSDVYYLQQHRIPAKYQGSYLLNFNKRQVIGSYLGLLGQHIAHAGYFDKGVQMCKEGIKTNPRFEESYRLLAIVYNNERVYNLAIREYKRALEINPSDPNVRVGLAIAYFNTGNPDHAISELKKAVEVYPDHAEAHFYLGRIYEDKRWAGKALEEYTRVLELEPQNRYARERLVAMGVNPANIVKDGPEVPAASEGTPDGAAAPSQQVEQFIKQGEHSYKLGRYADASTAFSQAHKLSPENTDALIGLARARFSLGQRDEAKRICLHAINLGAKPDDMFLRSLGIVLKKGTR